VHSIGTAQCDRLNSLPLQFGDELVAVMGPVADQSFKLIGDKPVFNSIVYQGVLKVLRSSRYRRLSGLRDQASVDARVVSFPRLQETSEDALEARKPPPTKRV